MANWVSNSLDIIGTKDEVEEFMKFVNAEHTVTHFDWKDDEDGNKVEVLEDITYSSKFNFNAIVPAPTEPNAYSDHIDENGKVQQPWYDWNINNWGTKWNAREVSVDRMADNCVSYYFDTAWSPPTPIIEKLAKLFPTVKIHYRYEEEQGWGGEVIINEGSVITAHEWDIPETHAESVQYRGWCYCEESPDELSYPDCPKDEVADV